MNEFWQSCINQLEQEFPPQQISAWIRPLIPLAYDESQAVLRLSAPNRFKLDWVRKNFATQIETFAATWFEKPVQVLFELATSGNQERQNKTVAASVAREPVRVSHIVQDFEPEAPSSNTTMQKTPVTQNAAVSAVDERSRLNTELTFENFVTGKANQLARAAAQAGPVDAPVGALVEQLHAAAAASRRRH